MATKKGFTISKMLGHHHLNEVSTLKNQSEQTTDNNFSISSNRYTDNSIIFNQKSSASNSSLKKPTSSTLNHSSDRYKDTVSLALEAASQAKTSISQTNLRVESKILYNNNPCPIPFVVHKILDYLQDQKEMVTLSQLEQHFKKNGFTGLNILTNKELFNLLQSSNRILFDPQRKKFAYINPYEKIVSTEALLACIVNDGQYTGLRVTDDLLAANSFMKDWIHALLKERKIRCVRPNNSHLRGKLKCKMVNSDNTCSLYSKIKCQECYDNVKDLILYPLSDSEYESSRLKVNVDVKSLWDSIEMPLLEDVLKEFNINTPLPKYSSNLGNSKRSKGQNPNKITTKIRRIHNVHLFTPEDLRSEIYQQQKNSWGNTSFTN